MAVNKDGGAGQERRPPAYTTSLMAGALSGLSVDLLFYPIDTLKTRLQSSQGFWRAGGFSGIYRGIGSVAVGSAPGAACFFVTYEGLKPWLEPDGNGSQQGPWSRAGAHMVAASLAEVAACMIRVPTEVVKSRQQTSAYGLKTSSLKALQAVVQENGIRGLYVGYAGTVGREIPFTCIQFPLYEQLKLLIARSPFFQNLDPSATAGSSDKRDGRSIPTWQAGLAGSVAGSIAAGLTTPLDVVKTRIMLDRRARGEPSVGPVGVNTKILPTLRHIAVNEGFRALFSGFLPRTIWIGLGGFVFLGTFEAGVKVLQGDVA